MLSDTESHSIALKVLPAPHFADGEKFAVQQGAGMAVAKTTDAEGGSQRGLPQVADPAGE